MLAYEEYLVQISMIFDIWINHNLLRFLDIIHFIYIKFNTVKGINIDTVHVTAIY